MMQNDYEETRATARLPYVDIEVLHRRPWAGGEEQMAVLIHAVSPFETVRRILEAANPLLVWSQMLQMAWSPWLSGFTEAPAKLQQQPSDHRGL